MGRQFGKKSGIFGEMCQPKDGKSGLDDDGQGGDRVPNDGAA